MNYDKANVTEVTLKAVNEIHGRVLKAEAASFAAGAAYSKVLDRVAKAESDVKASRAEYGTAVAAYKKVGKDGYESESISLLEMEDMAARVIEATKATKAAEAIAAKEETVAKAEEAAESAKDAYVKAEEIAAVERNEYAKAVFGLYCSSLPMILREW